MKPIICWILIFAILMCWCLAGCLTNAETKTNSKYPISGVSPAMGGIAAVNFELSKPLPDFPNKLQVYQMVKPDITGESVKALGAKFGLIGEVMQDTSGFAMQNKETGAYLSIYRATGTFRYSIDSKIFPPSASVIQKSPVLPSDAEALKIATDFLVERRLLPEGDVAYKVEVGGRFGEIPTHLLVSFKHAIQMTGPGGVHAVRIGDGGEIVEVFINPTNPLVLPTLEMATAKPVQQAFQEMINLKHYAAPSNAQTVLIDNVIIAYWIESNDEGQDYVAPVYKFTGRCRDENGKTMDSAFVGVVEALK
jgi:hypothetical protein